MDFLGLTLSGLGSQPLSLQERNLVLGGLIKAPGPHRRSDWFGDLPGKWEPLAALFWGSKGT